MWVLSLGCLTLLTAVVFIVASLWPDASQEERPDLRKAATAAAMYWPHDCLVGAVLTVPRQQFKRSEELRALLAEHAPRLLGELEKAELLFRAEGYDQVVGFDPEDPKAWAENGFDLDGSLHIAMRIKVKEKSTPVVLAVPVTDGDKALKVLRRVWRHPMMDTHRAVFDCRWPRAFERDAIVTDKDLAMVAQERDGWLFLTVAADEETGRKELEDWFADAEAASLGTDEAFRSTLQSLPERHHTAILFNAKPLIEQRPEIFGKLPVWNAGVSWAEDGFCLLAAVSPETEWLSKWESAGTCHDFMARLPEPLAAFSYSLRDPRPLIERIVDRKGIPDEKKREMCDAFCKLLNEGTGGILLYPKGEGEVSPRYIAFVKSERAKELADRVLEGLETDEAPHSMARAAKKHIGKQTFVNRNGLLVGTCDDWLLLSNAPDQLRAALTHRRERWTPKTGTSDLLAAEIYLKPIADQLLAPDSKWRPALDELPDNCPLYAKLDRVDCVYRMQCRWPGWPEKYFCLLPCLEEHVAETRALVDSAK